MFLCALCVRFNYIRINNLFFLLIRFVSFYFIFSFPPYICVRSRLPGGALEVHVEMCYYDSLE